MYRSSVLVDVVIDESERDISNVVLLSPVYTDSWHGSAFKKNLILIKHFRIVLYYKYLNILKSRNVLLTRKVT